MTQPVSLLPRLFAEAGNALKPTAHGFTTGHEPAHASSSGTCVRIDANKNVWFCHNCQQGGDVIAAVMSLRCLSREDASAYLRDTAGEEVSDKKSKSSQATELVALAEQAILWHTPDGDPWATFLVHEHHEHANIRTKAFRRWLVGLYYKKHQSAPGGQGVQDALGILEAKAVHDGTEYPVFVRVAECDGKVYLDLANERWEVIEITTTGWRVIADPPVRFKRVKGMLALPLPVSGGTIEALRPFINVTDDDWILVKAWLLGALSPQGPYPLLELHGESGSAKSTAARLLRALIDPSTVPLRKTPKEEKDLIVASASSWLQVLDNLSHVPPWLSDALCRLSTGGGLADRELYTDGEIFLVDVQRPCILTGIEDLATRGDLLDRAIPLFLEKIDDDNRVAEKHLWREFEVVRPRILGALLDAVSCSLKHLPSTTLARTPRMADFAIQVVAASEALGFTPEEFLDAYTGKRDELHAAVIESSLVAQLIIRLVAKVLFTGTAQSLLVHLEILAEDKEKKSKFFPTSPRGLSNAVRRIAPNLRAVGYTVEFTREGKKGERLIHLEHTGKTSSASSASSASAKDKGFSDNSADDGRRKPPPADANDPAGTSDPLYPSSTNGRTADANSQRLTMADATGVPPSSATNINNNNGLTSKNRTADAADAKFPGCSTSSPGGSEEMDRSEQEERQAIQEEDDPCSIPTGEGRESIIGNATGSTVEVGDSNETPEFEYITTAARLEAVMSDLLAAPVLGLDTETTGLDPLKDQLRLIQIATPHQTVVIDAFTCPVPILAPVFSQPRQMIGHNLKFDLQFLIAAGVPWPTGAVFDTMLTAQLLGAGSNDGQLRNCGLAAVAKRCLGISLDKSEQAGQWASTLRPEQLVYAAKDAATLLPLASRLQDDLAKYDLLQIADIEHRCLFALAWMELAGLPIEREQWLTRAAEETHRAQALHAQLYALLGRPQPNGKVLHLSEEPHVNWNSPEQVLSVFHARGHTLDNTSSESLTTLIGSEPLAEVLLDYREAKKRAGTYGTAWLTDHLHTVTGRVHADYFQLGAASGRMSCTKPNVQNLPRNGTYRRSVCPGEGRAIVKADFSQIELRIAAVLADESNMLAAFREGEDLHRLTAAKVLGISLDQVGKEHRQLAKALNFGLLYGMGAKALQVYAATNYKVPLSESQAKAHRQRFFHAYPGLARWHAQTGRHLEEEQLVETRTLTNRRRLGVTSFTVALNSPVQGTGADGLKLALARLFEHRREVPDARVIACVHDEIVAECPQESAEQTAAWLTHHMTVAMTEIIGETVPVEVETTIGRDWAGTPLGAQEEGRL